MAWKDLTEKERRETLWDLKIGMVVGPIVLILILLFAPRPGEADSPEVDISRVGSNPWICAGSDGLVISRHSEMQVAFESCSNRALAAPEAEFFVRSADFRIKANVPVAAPPPDPDPDPDPPPPPPPPAGEQPIASFGPVTSPTLFANQTEFERTAFRWEMRVTLNSVSAKQGLFSRDAFGQAESGHLSLWVDAGGRVSARNQGLGTDFVLLTSSASLSPGTESIVVVSMDGAGIALVIDGVVEDQSTVAYSLIENTLPLTLGGSCRNCDELGNSPDEPIDGAVSLEVFAEPLEITAGLPPGDVTVTATWKNPTHNTDDTPYTNPELTRVQWSGSRSGSLEVLHPAEFAVIGGFDVGDNVSLVALACNIEDRCSAPSAAATATIQ